MVGVRVEDSKYGKLIVFEASDDPRARPLQFGIRKAKFVLDNIEALRRFVEENQ